MVFLRFPWETVWRRAMGAPGAASAAPVPGQAGCGRGAGGSSARQGAPVNLRFTRPPLARPPTRPLQAAQPARGPNETAAAPTRCVRCRAARPGRCPGRAWTRWPRRRRHRGEPEGCALGLPIPAEKPSSPQQLACQDDLRQGYVARSCRRRIYGLTAAAVAHMLRVLIER